jgi:hypothetical protein
MINYKDLLRSNKVVVGRKCAAGAVGSCAYKGRVIACGLAAFGRAPAMPTLEGNGVGTGMCGLAVSVTKGIHCCGGIG